MNGHFSLERILAYFSEGTDEVELALMESHFAGCELCAARARRAFAVCDGWTAETQAAAAAAEARATDPLFAALTWARSRGSAWQERLQNWLASSQSQWALPGQPVAEFGTGAVAVRGSKSGIMQVKLPAGATRARVHIRKSIHTLEVQIAALAGMPPSPVVLLFTEDESTEPQLAVAAQSAPGAAWIARFEDVPSGSCLLAIESIPQQNPL